MRLTGLILLAGLAVSACDSPPSQQGNLVNATQTDQAFPSAADGNDIIAGSQTTPPAGAEQGTRQGQQQDSPPQ